MYLNRLRERNVSIETALALTGHRALHTVSKYYREIPDRDLRAAVAALDRHNSRRRGPGYLRLLVPFPRFVELMR